MWDSSCYMKATVRRHTCLLNLTERNHSLQRTRFIGQRKAGDSKTLRGYLGDKLPSLIFFLQKESGIQLRRFNLRVSHGVLEFSNWVKEMYYSIHHFIWCINLEIPSFCCNLFFFFFCITIAFFFSCYIFSIFRVVCESKEFCDSSFNFSDYIMKKKILQSVQPENISLKRKN